MFPKVIVSLFTLLNQSTVFWDAARIRSWSCGSEREALTKILWYTRLCILFIVLLSYSCFENWTHVSNLNIGLFMSFPYIISCLFSTVLTYLAGLYTTFIFQKPDPDVAPPLMTPLLHDGSHGTQIIDEVSFSKHMTCTLVWCFDRQN